MPFKPGEREYRSIFSSFRAVESENETTEPTYMVEGYATTFDVPYDFGRGGAKECISSRSLDGADMSDVIFQVNHEGTPLARLRNKSLELIRDAHGLLVRAYLGGSQAGRDLYEAISNGLVDRMSWGFSVSDDGWEYDRATRTSTVTRIEKVYDVSAVSLPANEDTIIHARSYLDGVIEAEERESLLRERESRHRAALKLRLL